MRPVFQEILDQNATNSHDLVERNLIESVMVQRKFKDL